MPGDRVLVGNTHERGGPGRPRSYWESEVHVVVEQQDNGPPVFEVRPESGTKPSRVLHGNLLVPCTYLPVDQSNLKEPHSGKGRSRQQKETSTPLKQQMLVPEPPTDEPNRL